MQIEEIAIADMNVILLNGAIASGKTTIGKALVKRIREQPGAATFYDLDDETRKLNPRLEWEQEEQRLRDWLYSRKMLALKTTEDIRKGTEVVIAGPFFLKEEITGYSNYIPRNVSLFLYTLITPLEERIYRDAARAQSNIIADLHRQQEEIDHLPKQYGYEVSNTGTVEEAADTILQLVHAGIGRLDRREFSRQNIIPGELRLS
jgi:shikimate kinase